MIQAGDPKNTKYTPGEGLRLCTGTRRQPRSHSSPITDDVKGPRPFQGHRSSSWNGPRVMYNQLQAPRGSAATGVHGVGVFMPATLS